jgi:hypothetical protein
MWSWMRVRSIYLSVQTPANHRKQRGIGRNVQRGSQQRCISQNTSPIGKPSCRPRQRSVLHRQRQRQQQRQPGLRLAVVVPELAQTSWGDGSGVVAVGTPIRGRFGSLASHYERSREVAAISGFWGWRSSISLQKVVRGSKVEKSRIALVNTVRSQLGNERDRVFTCTSEERN